MPVIGGNRRDEKPVVESEETKQAAIGIAVEMELARYRATLRDIDNSTEQRKLSAQRMFAERIEAIVQRYSPVVSGPSPSTDTEGDSPE